MAFTPKSSTNNENVLVVKEPIEQFQDYLPDAVYDDTYEIGQWDKSYGNQRNVVVKGTIAYLASGNDGLIALDISDPANPVKIGQYNLPEDEYVFTVAIDGNTAFLACDFYGLVSLDITDPSNIQFLDRINIGSYYFDVVADSGIVYVGQGWEGVVIYDASDPSDLVNISQIYDGKYVNTIKNTK